MTDGAAGFVTHPSARLVTMRGEFFFIFTEQVGAFPTHLLAKTPKLVTKRKIVRVHIAFGKSFFAGVVNVVILSISFESWRARIFELCSLDQSGAHPNARDIPFRRSVHDPFCHYFADTAHASKTMRTECTRYPETFDGGGTRRNSPSGVKPSGPLRRSFTGALSAAGTRRMEFSINGVKRMPNRVQGV